MRKSTLPGLAIHCFYRRIDMYSFRTLALAAVVSLLCGVTQANIVQNGDFTQSTGWTVSNIYEVGYGYGCLYMDADNNGFQVTSHTIAAGETFHVSWDSRTEAGFTAPNLMRAYLFYFDGADGFELTHQDCVTTNDYVTSTFDFTAVDGAEYIGKLAGIVLRNAEPKGSWASFANVSIEVTPVPEPATMSLLALGGVALLRRRRA